MNKAISLQLVLLLFCVINTSRSLSSQELSREKLDKMSIEEKVDLAREIAAEIPLEQKQFYNAIAHYNRTGDLDSLRIVEEELMDQSSDRHSTISQRLKLNEGSISIYMEYAKNEEDPHDFYQIVAALRNAPFTPEVIEFLRDVSSRSEVDGISIIAKRSLAEVEKHGKEMEEREGDFEELKPREESGQKSFMVIWIIAGALVLISGFALLFRKRSL